MARFVTDEDMPRSTGRALVEKGYEMKDVRDHGCRGLGDNSGAGPDQDKALSRLSLPSIPLCAFAALRESGSVFLLHRSPPVWRNSQT